jgi:NAD(P)H-dependent FMN reductase
LPKLQVVVVSTRPGRAGLPVGRWAFDAAVAHGGFDVEFVDLDELDLPLLDEPNHPRMANYTQEHTQRWSEKVADADAFVFVTPEYNYAAPPTLVNALDFLHNEWAYKPVGFVSYGGIAGGLRSVQMLKQIVTSLRMMPIPEGVPIPLVFQHLGPEGFTAPPMVAASVGPMIDELLRWTQALSELRNSPPPAPPAPPIPQAPPAGPPLSGPPATGGPVAR